MIGLRKCLVEFKVPMTGQKNKSGEFSVNNNYIREGFKKVCKITHLGGWVFQEWDKLHRKKTKKHAFKIHFRPF